jgi:hypothetical protein
MIDEPHTATRREEGETGEEGEGERRWALGPALCCSLLFDLPACFLRGLRAFCFCFVLLVLLGFARGGFISYLVNALRLLMQSR